MEGQKLSRAYFLIYGNGFLVKIHVCKLGIALSCIFISHADVEAS